jgi:outer membrane protein assembly factor BamD
VKHLALLLVAALTVGCGSSAVDLATLASNSDQLIWEAGQKAYEKHNFENARQHFKRIIDAFPQSQYAPAARLGLADAHLNEGGTANYILAVSEYRDFVTLYPSHAKSDYAQFQTGEAYFKQRNGPDRDQTPTMQALTEFQRLLDLYPQSSYVERARDRIHTCRQSLARAEFLAGFFYERTRKAYRAAISRYQGLLNDYPDYDQIDEALYRLGDCLVTAGRAAEALPHLSRLIESYPQSIWVKAAQTLMEQASKVAPAPSPAPPPAASPETPPAPAENPSPAPPPL